MSDHKTVEPSSVSRERSINRLKRAGLAFLFSAVLLIPRVRRLRRSVFAWTLVRVFTLVAGAWLVWRFVRGTAGIPSLLFAIGMALFGLLVKARPERKSVDDVARELNALVVLNGGSWINERHSKPVPETRIFVLSDRLLVLTPPLQQVAEIPLAGVRQIGIHPAVPGTLQKNGDAGAQAWEVEIGWDSANEAHVATFHFQGFFAEHLARVAEQTISSILKKHLPALKS